MNILITNDDGYRAKGIRVLVEIMKQFGDVTVIAPKHHQSGMSMAVSLGLKPMAYKELSQEEVDMAGIYKKLFDIPEGNGAPVRWAYLDATPASCVKFALNTIFENNYPDVIVSGINHGSNAAAAACYSGTLGAALEGALNGVPSIGVSLDNINPNADFSAVARFFPEIFSRIMDSLPEKHGCIYNVNFPNIPADNIRGVRIGRQGLGRWIREIAPWSADALLEWGITPEMLMQNPSPKCEEGESLYIMVGDFENDPANKPDADHLLMNEGYISVAAQNIDMTDAEEIARLHTCGLDYDF